MDIKNHLLYDDGVLYLGIFYAKIDKILLQRLNLEWLHRKYTYTFTKLINKEKSLTVCYLPWSSIVDHSGIYGDKYDSQENREWCADKILQLFSYFHYHRCYFDALKTTFIIQDNKIYLGPTLLINDLSIYFEHCLIFIVKLLTRQQYVDGPLNKYFTHVKHKARYYWCERLSKGILAENDNSINELYTIHKQIAEHILGHREVIKNIYAHYLNLNSAAAIFFLATDLYYQFIYQEKNKEVAYQYALQIATYYHDSSEIPSQTICACFPCSLENPYFQIAYNRQQLAVLTRSVLLNKKLYYYNLDLPALQSYLMCSGHKAADKYISMQELNTILINYK
jgi:hypothetical protein